MGLSALAGFPHDNPELLSPVVLIEPALAGGGFWGGRRIRCLIYSAPVISNTFPHKPHVSGTQGEMIGAYSVKRPMPCTDSWRPRSFS